MTPSQIVKGNEFEAVREFVRDELCDKNELERDAFEMSERVLTRQGKPCGFYFCIYGPRSVRLTAVWDLGREMILFYDSLGRRAASCKTPCFE
ncbi:MAG: hypothetical protein AB8B50_06475 [Pirellulaceae bacterium]